MRRKGHQTSDLTLEEGREPLMEIKDKTFIEPTKICIHEKN